MNEPETGVVTLQRVATHFSLGTIDGAAEARHGGVNRLWRVPTERGVFAVHELLGIPEGVDPVERCQRVYDLEVAASAAGVSIASPIPGPDAACVLVPGTAGPVVVHRWVDAMPVHVDRTDSSLYERLGWSLAHIHGLGIDPARGPGDLLERRPTTEEWCVLAEKAEPAGWSWAPDIERAAFDLAEGIRMVDEWDRAANEVPVCSHRDLTSANILDNHGEPVLIDWEDAGPIGAGNEIGRTALDNLGRLGQLDPDSLAAFLRGYDRVVPLPALGPHWCSLWVRGLIVYAEHCARSCITGTAPSSLLAIQSHVVATAPTELRRRLELVDSLVAAFEEGLPGTSSRARPPDKAVTYRTAIAADARAIAELHADSWRRNYRGAYPEEFFGVSLDADRLSVWSTRLHDRGDAHTFVAEDSNVVVGFVHVILNGDPEWGALVDNLHVRSDCQHRGIASQLMGRAASVVAAAAPGSGLYLWVLEQNTRAQAFYESIGGQPADRRAVEPPALLGVDGIRYVWPNPPAM